MIKNKKIIIFGKKVIKACTEKRPDLIKKIIITQDNQHLKKEFGSGYIYDFWTKEQFKNSLPKEKHQKCIAILKSYKFTPWSDLLEDVKFETKKDNLILILDRIQDPQNYGLLIRSAVAAGVKYIIVTKKSQCSINSTIAKVSVGSLFDIRIVEVDNLLKAIELLKRLNFSIFSSILSKDSISYYKLNLKENKNIALIVGNENDGINPELVKESTKKIQIPINNKVESLNVIIAASIILFDIKRQQQKFYKKVF